MSLKSIVCASLLLAVLSTSTMAGNIGGLKSTSAGNIGGLRTNRVGNIGGLRADASGNIGGLRTNDGQVMTRTTEYDATSESLMAEGFLSIRALFSLLISFY